MNEIIDKEETTEQLISLIKHPNKRAFLENYPKFLISKTTCEAIGIGESTVRAWKRDDGGFNSAFIALKKEIQQHKIEVHEKNIYDVALDTRTPAQSRIFGSLVILRAEEPEKWREKPVGIPISGEITVVHKIPRPGRGDAVQREDERPQLAQAKDEGEKGYSEAKQ